MALAQVTLPPPPAPHPQPLSSCQLFKTDKAESAGEIGQVVFLLLYLSHLSLVDNRVISTYVIEGGCKKRPHTYTPTMELFFTPH